MKKLLSYILFGDEGRYWNNIPFVIIANSFIYSDFHMKFFVHEACVKHPFFPLLRESAKEFSNIDLEIINQPAERTKLTIWRMKPLWENDADFLFCRDLDYAPTDLERKSVEYFTKQTVKSFCGIRSYHLHTIILMAGMCGFKIKEMHAIIKGKAPTFDSYLKFGVNFVGYCKDWRWGCDQALLRDFFHPFLEEHFLDFPIQTAPKNIASVNVALRLPDDYKKIKLPLCNEAVLNYSSSLSNFAGQPFACKGEQLRRLMSIADNKTVRFFKKLFKENTVFKCFES